MNNGRGIRDRSPVPLQAGLELFFKNLGAPPLNVLTQLSERWNDIVGPALGEFTKPARFQNNILEISCTDAAWASQISWMEEQIKERFAEIFSPTAIEKIKITVS